MELSGVKLKMSTSKHPQTDGATEIMNRMVGNYLRCNCSYRQNDWDELPSAAEFAYNTAVTEDLGMSPFEIDLGSTPKSPLDMIFGKERPAQNVEEFKEKLKLSFEDTHYCYKISKASQITYSSVKYRIPNFKVGGTVWLNRPVSRMRMGSLNILIS